MFFNCKVYRLNSRLVQRYDSARRRDLYLRTHSAHKRHISIFLELLMMSGMPLETY
jgi:hypothetical protein